MFYEFKHSIDAEYFTIEKGTNFSFPAHMHHCFEMIAVTSGNMTITCDNTDYTLSESEAVLIFPNQIHAIKSNGPCRHVLCIFSPNIISAYTSITKALIPKDNRFVPDKSLVKKLTNTDNNCNILEKKGILYSFVSEFHKNANYKTSENQSNSLLYNIFKFIDMNYKKCCSLYELSKSLGYEYTYLSRYFKKIVGMSYNEYVNEYRISMVCRLLTDSELSILEISEECGFNSLRSLNRNFKERLGCTPGVYKNERRKIIIPR